MLLALMMAACLVPATRTLGQVASNAPFLFTPSSPRDVAVAALAGRPVGQRVIVLSGFDSDIANYDQILVKSTAVAASGAPKTSRSNGSSFTLVKNPAMVTGRFVVRSRVADWLKGLKEGGATVDRVIVQAPDAAIGDALAGATFSHANALVKDSRAAAAFGGLTSAARARTTKTFQSWSQVIADAAKSLSFDTHRFAVQASFPSAVTERAKPGLVTQSPTSSGTQSSSGSTQSSSGSTQSGSGSTQSSSGSTQSGSGSTQSGSGSTQSSSGSTQSSSGSTQSSSGSTQSGSGSTQSSSGSTPSGSGSTPSGSGSTQTGAGSTQSGSGSTQSSSGGTQLGSSPGSQLLPPGERAAVEASAGYLRAKGVAIEPGRAEAILRQASAISQWDRLFDVASTNAAARKILDDAVVSADVIVAMDPQSTYRRPLKFDDIPSNQIDSVALGAGMNRDARALSMSDCRQSDFLRSHGVTLAIAVRRAGRPEHTARMMDMLSEVAQWSPLQRPGWSLGSASAVLSAGGDGVNMATSWGVTGIIDILTILGDRVPADLRAKLETAVRRELGSIVDSWANSRAWYVGSDAIISNQWIDPNAAAIHACLFLRDERLAAIYELAASNLLRSLNALQPDGAFLEGVTYAQMSLPSVYRAAAKMAENGDSRAQSVPFIRNSWKWMLAVQMPGGNLVSACDSRMATLPTWATRAPLDCFALAAVAAGDSSAVASLRAIFPACGSWSSAADYAVALTSVTPLATPAISPWGYFPSQQLVTWREGFAPAVDQSREIGIWIKGGTLLERSHGQRDQGHVSIYCGSTPILQERGTPDYGDPSYLTEYASARGHGIMQVDPVLPSNQCVNAPAEVQRLDASGGLVRLDLRAAYCSATTCERTVSWDRGGPVTISDSVTFTDWQPAGTELYRFHLGASAPPSVTLSGGVWTVAWESASLRISSTGDLVAEVVEVPNALRAPYKNYALLLRAGSACRAQSIVTEVTVQR
jgi:hypothetical protein